MDDLPDLMTVEEVKTYLRIKNTKLFALLKAGDLERRKQGRNTVILGQSVKAYVERLPKR